MLCPCFRRSTRRRAGVYALPRPKSGISRIRAGIPVLMRHFLLRDQATQAVAAAQAAGGPSDGSLLGAEGTAHTRAS